MSPRKSKRNATTEPPPPSIVSKEKIPKVFFINDELSACDQIDCISLRHPQLSSHSLFLLARDENDKTHFAELNAFDEGTRSWFIGNKVTSDGKLFIATPFNPVYIVLPYLMKAERNIPLDQLLMDSEFPDTVKLAPLVTNHMDSVADMKGPADLNVWKYNEEKTLQWLETKTRKLSEKLMDEKVAASTAQSLTFVRTMSYENNKELYLSMAHGLISEYITESLSKQLHSLLKLPSVDALKPKKSESNQPEVKKTKTSAPTEDYTKHSNTPEVKKSNVPKTAKSKALAKSAVGTKSIMSFFSKK